jgi:hypothetical protein
MNSQINRVLIVALASSWFFAIISGSFPFVLAQSVDNHLPIVLIHGYGQHEDEWNTCFVLFNVFG